jgi:DNA invertase Pin-like site-specific DNA recombinase
MLTVMHKRPRPEIIGLLVCKCYVQNGGAKMIISYARVSTDGQSLESQLAALKAAGAEKVFAEKISGAKTDRRALASAIKSLGPGDVLLVTRLDRLARSTRDLLNVLDAVAKAGAGFRSIADPMIDTTSPHGKLILAVLAALAEFERSMILSRTSEGRTRAKARGVRFGRKPSAPRRSRTAESDASMLVAVRRGLADSQAREHAVDFERWGDHQLRRQPRRLEPET